MLTGPHLVKKFHVFVEPGGSLLCSQEPVTCPCLEPHEYIYSLPSYFLTLS